MVNSIVRSEAVVYSGPPGLVRHGLRRAPAGGPAYAQSQSCGGLPGVEQGHSNPRRRYLVYRNVAATGSINAKVV